jgi:hypothetical protein
MPLRCQLRPTSLKNSLAVRTCTAADAVLVTDFLDSNVAALGVKSGCFGQLRRSDADLVLEPTRGQTANLQDVTPK